MGYEIEHEEGWSKIGSRRRMVEDRLAKTLLGVVFVEWNSLGSCVCMSSRGYTIIICGLILKGIKIEDSLNCRPV